jgi:AraC-like DNA-binding protein
MRPERFDSRDVGQIEAFVSTIYSKMRIGAVGGCTRAQITRRALAPEVGFDDLDYSFDIGYSAEPQGQLIICDVVSNTIRRDHDGGEETFGPGDQFLISRPDLPYAGVAHATRLRFMVLDPALLARVAATTGHDAADPRAGPPADLSAGRTAAAGQHRLRARHCAGRPRGGAGATGGLDRESVSGRPCVAHFPEHGRGRAEQHGPPRRASGPAAARGRVHRRQPRSGHRRGRHRAAAHVTPRGLQLAFRRHLDTTPMAYLRRVRLDHAREDLRAAIAGDGHTVTTIAARWGFTPSHFTQHYRAAYGELPSHTLREQDDITPPP